MLFSVLWQRQLGDRKGNHMVKPRATDPKVLLQNRCRKTNQVEPADPGTHGKLAVKMEMMLTGQLVRRALHNHVNTDSLTWWRHLVNVDKPSCTYHWRTCTVTRPCSSASWSRVVLPTRTGTSSTWQLLITSKWTLPFTDEPLALLYSSWTPHTHTHTHAHTF